MLHSLGAHTWQALGQVAACVLLLPRFLLTAAMLWLLDFLCIRKKLLLTATAAAAAAAAAVTEEGAREREAADGEEAADGAGSPPDDPPLCVSDSNRMFTLESLKAVWHGQKLDFFKAAHVGAAAPNPEVIQLDGRTRTRILDYARGKRPLILNFGSCT
ncbi:Thyroxine 5-deiodinase [Varanus komodoensis]|nr:Thyroxine 5-deiodinase [Varanus komodoensis]